MFIWTTRTILVFGKKVTWYRKTLPKKRKWGKVTFWDHSKKELIHWRYILKSSPMLGSTPQGLLFLINKHFWNFRTCPFWRNCIIAYIWSECWPTHADVLRRLLGKALGFRLLKCISGKTFNLDNYGEISLQTPIIIITRGWGYREADKT